MYHARPNDCISSSSSSLGTKDDPLILLASSSVHEEKEDGSVCPPLERRRASFRQLSLGTSSIDHASLKVMREAVYQARTPRARKFRVQRQEEPSADDVVREKDAEQQATKIQASFRGYISRQSQKKTWKPAKKRTHHRFCSDLTISDWGGSMHSLESLGWSLVHTNTQKSEEVLHQRSIFQSPRKNVNVDASDPSWNTSTTMRIFDQDYIDLPVRAPSRKLSPHVCFIERDSPLQHPKRSPSPTPPQARFCLFRADTN
jgi:hypothetical protein